MINNIPIIDQPVIDTASLTLASTDTSKHSYTSSMNNNTSQSGLLPDNSAGCTTHNNNNYIQHDKHTMNSVSLRSKQQAQRRISTSNGATVFDLPPSQPKYYSNIIDPCSIQNELMNGLMYVNVLIKNCVADQAGLKLGDIITKVCISHINNTPTRYSSLLIH